MTDETNNPQFLYYNSYLAKASALLCISKVTQSARCTAELQPPGLGTEGQSAVQLLPLCETTHTAPERRLGEILLGPKGIPLRNTK